MIVESTTFLTKSILHHKVDDNYSPGEAQKLKITGLLSDSFKFLLIDEPTSHFRLKAVEGKNYRKAKFKKIRISSNFA